MIKPISFGCTPTKFGNFIEVGENEYSSSQSQGTLNSRDLDKINNLLSAKLAPINKKLGIYA